MEAASSWMSSQWLTVQRLEGRTGRGGASRSSFGGKTISVKLILTWGKVFGLVDFICVGNWTLLAYVTSSRRQALGGFVSLFLRRYRF